MATLVLKVGECIRAVLDLFLKNLITERIPVL